MDQFSGEKLRLSGIRNAFNGVPFQSVYGTSSISNIANGSYFVNGTEPSSADHPFILQRSVAARCVGFAVLLGHFDGQEAFWEAGNGDSSRFGRSFGHGIVFPWGRKSNSLGILFLFLFLFLFYFLDLIH
jgi:hypothetical protein